MPQFFNVLPPQDALRALLEQLEPLGDAELVSTHEALGRITASEVTSPEDLPAFPRSTMDGFSVRAVDTHGASEGLPAYLEVVGEVPMGGAPSVRLAAGQAAGAYTGGMLAREADAVVMVENTQSVDETTLEVFRPVAAGENVVQVGEDVRVGDTIVSSGHVIRPQDIGGCQALGITQIRLSRRPRVAIVSTGDELVPPEDSPGPGQVRDINTYTIAALVESAGGVPLHFALVRDDYEAQRSVAVEALAAGDMLVFSAGSSVSSRDMTADVLGSLGSPGLLAHGISHKPGKPTIVGLVDGKPVFGLPGNPVSAAVVFGLLVRPTVYALCGCLAPPESPTVRAHLARDIPSVTGREDHVQVRLVRNNGVIQAEPVFGKSNLIYTLVRADGTVIVPLDKGGLYADEEVEVRLY